MRLLLVNPNTTVAITDKVAALARAAAAPGTTIDATTARFGARYIGSRAASAIAAHAALDAYAAWPEPHDAVVLACFGDPGLEALREAAPCPVVGMAEASIHAACQMGRRFAIVTGGARWVPMLEEFVAARGLSARLARVIATPQTGDTIARNPEAALGDLAAACGRAVMEAGADVVIVGGAGLAGIAARLTDRVSVPLIDSLVASITQAEAVARSVAAAAAPTITPVESVGLPPALAARVR